MKPEMGIELHDHASEIGNAPSSKENSNIINYQFSMPVPSNIHDNAACYNDPPACIVKSCTFTHIYLQHI